MHVHRKTRRFISFFTSPATAYSLVCALCLICVRFFVHHCTFHSVSPALAYSHCNTMICCECECAVERRQWIKATRVNWVYFCCSYAFQEINFSFSLPNEMGHLSITQINFTQILTSTKCLKVNLTFSLSEAQFIVS